MSKSDTIEVEKEIGNQVRLYIYSLPKKNHDAMLQDVVNLLKCLEDMDVMPEVFSLIEPRPQKALLV